jgi:type IV pilus assembly protein PilB
MNLKNKTPVDIVEDLIDDAILIGASDIHIDPYREDVLVRVRLHGDLQEVIRYSIEIHSEIVSRIKILANLKIDEHNSPQDGRFNFSESSDIRIVITPSYFGEAVVMRLLQPYNSSIDLSVLGFSHNDIKIIKDKISKPSGLILISGPTGSGKTTTLYTLLKELLSPSRSIITIEDPIEYIMLGSRQISVGGDRNNFSSILRSALRQDPNIIMIGEIRDAETAKVAINASLTGHLVLSTIHTKDAQSVVSRFLSMGIEKYLIEATLSLVISQRLLKKACNKCRYHKELSFIERELVDEYYDFFYEDFSGARGCEHCSHLGYDGRVAVYEILSNFSNNNVPQRNILQDAIYKASKGQILFKDILTLINT